MKRLPHSVPLVARSASFFAFGLTLAALLPACSSKSGAGAPGAGGSGSDPVGAGAGAVAGAGMGAGGTSGGAVAYPAGPYGVGEGKVVENATFYGYPSVAAQQRQLISLGDFYNPEGSTLTTGGVPVTALLVTVGAVWCNPCQQEAGVLGAVANKFIPAGVQVMQDLYEGADATSGAPATQAELDQWITSHALPFPVFIDPAKKLAPYFDVSSLPFIMLLDTKTMTNVAEEVGFGGQPALEAFICANAPEKPSVCP